jgi:uncharacterized protein YabE (DUF348 family)
MRQQITDNRKQIIVKRKKNYFLLVFFIAIFLGVYFLSRDTPMVDFSGVKAVTIDDDGIVLGAQDIEGDTVGDILGKSGIRLREKDSVWPDISARATSGQIIFITRSREVKVKIDGGERTVLTQARTIGELFPMENIRLDEDDIVKPDRSESVTEGSNIVVTRVEIREEVKETAVAFETKVTEDSTLSWRKKITTQKGEKGVRATTYRVAYHDGKEVSRKILKTEITKDPTAELVTQGTFVKLGKKHEGDASWYAYTGTMSAANPWLPKGSYVKVTNLDNGKSVIVVINDRGPFVGGRIIDLDKVAFAKVASLGAGVIRVRMEEILN